MNFRMNQKDINPETQSQNPKNNLKSPTWITHPVKTCKIDLKWLEFNKTKKKKTSFSDQKCIYKKRKERNLTWKPWTFLGTLRLSEGSEGSKQRYRERNGKVKSYNFKDGSNNSDAPITPLQTARIMRHFRFLIRDIISCLFKFQNR